MSGSTEVGTMGTSVQGYIDSFGITLVLPSSAAPSAWSTERLRLGEAWTGEMGRSPAGGSQSVLGTGSPLAPGTELPDVGLAHGMGRLLVPQTKVIWRSWLV